MDPVFPSRSRIPCRIWRTHGVAGRMDRRSNALIPIVQYFEIPLSNDISKMIWQTRQKSNSYTAIRCNSKRCRNTCLNRWHCGYQRFGMKCLASITLTVGGSLCDQCLASTEFWIGRTLISPLPFSISQSSWCWQPLYDPCDGGSIWQKYQPWVPRGSHDTENLNVSIWK